MPSLRRWNPTQVGSRSYYIRKLVSIAGTSSWIDHLATVMARNSSPVPAAAATTASLTSKMTSTLKTHAGSGWIRKRLRYRLAVVSNSAAGDLELADATLAEGGWPRCAVLDVITRRDAPFAFGARLQQLTAAAIHPGRCAASALPQPGCVRHMHDLRPSRPYHSAPR